MNNNDSMEATSTSGSYGTGTTNSNAYTDMTDQTSTSTDGIPVINVEEEDAAAAEDANTADINKTINDKTILPVHTPEPEPPVTVTKNSYINDVSVIDSSSVDDFVAAVTSREPPPPPPTTTATLMDITSMNSFDSTTLLPENNIITSTVDGNHIAWNTTATTTTNNNNNTNTKTNITSVTSERKEQLLLQARYDRIQWIHQIPLPYMKHHHHSINPYTTTNHHHSTTVTTTTTKCSPTPSKSHATYHLPTIPKVVQYLYGSTSKSMTTILDVDTYMTELYQQQQQQQQQQQTQQLGQEQQQMKQSSNQQHNNNIPNPNIYRMTGTQIMDAELQQQQQLIHVDNDKSLLLLQYQKFIHALEDPSAATIVQKLRSYIRQLHKNINNNQNTIFKATRNENDTNNGDDDIEHVPMIITKFQSYIYSIYDTLQNHPLFIEMIQNNDNDNNYNHNISRNENNEQRQLLLRRCYDSFVYGHCYSYFESLLYTDDVRDKNQLFQTNVQFLSSFVTPIHLDIHCFVAILLSSNETKKPGNDTSVESVSTDSIDNYHEQNVKELLSKCVMILQSIDTYYSPYEKLQRILLLYHEINIALKRATKSTTKLPSADDVLPTFIYVILLASSTLEHGLLSNPSNLYYNLYYIEQLLTTSSFKNNDTTLNNHGSSSSSSSNHYLRGEAGYAYTNLYSAYQFISDFDTSNLINPFDATSSSIAVADDTTALPPPPPSSLSISKDAWNTAIESYKVKAQERYEAIQKASSATETLRIDTYEPDLSIGMQFDTPTLNAPTPMEIRQARLRGETIDLNWALQHKQRKDHELASHVSNQQHPILRTQKSIFEQVEENLPYGFQRNYNFLNARTVDDLKYNDVEQLLHEYHTLVRTTETLLSERARQITRERKVQQLQKEKALLEQEQQVILLLNNDIDAGN